MAHSVADKCLDVQIHLTLTIHAQTLHEISSLQPDVFSCRPRGTQMHNEFVVERI